MLPSLGKGLQILQQQRFPPSPPRQLVQLVALSECQVLSGPRGQEHKALFLTVARRKIVMETMSEHPSSPREQEPKSQHEGRSYSWRVMVTGYQEGRR